jgi:tetratricopeptide (TPR) repeat protein
MTESDRPQSQRVRLGELLVQRGAITDEDINHILEHQREHGGRFASAALALELTSQDELVGALSAQMRFPGLTIERCPVEAVRESKIPISLLRELRVLPCRSFRRTLVIAMADPQNLRVLGALEAVCRQRVQPVLALQSVIQAQLDLLPNDEPRDQSTVERATTPTRSPLPIPATVRTSESERQDAERRSTLQTDARVGLRDALRALKDGEYDAARSAARKSIKADPFDGRGHFAMARALRGLGRHDEARKALEQTVALQPDYYAAWRILAMSHEEHGEVEPALSAWTSAARACSDDATRSVIQDRVDLLHQKIKASTVL